MHWYLRVLCHLCLCAYLHTCVDALYVCVCVCVQAGVGAILVGESLVKQGDPATGIKKLLSLQ